MVSYFMITTVITLALALQHSAGLPSSSRTHKQISLGAAEYHDGGNSQYPAPDRYVDHNIHRR